jgi:hypothetical protein
VFPTGAGIRRVALTGGAAVLAMAGGMSAAFAVTSHYASYDFGSGQVSLPAAGFPAAHVSTDSTNPTAPSGASAYLNASTPFGQVFGSSQGEPYALLHLASGRKPSTTEVTFDSPPEAGEWGFALGDIDAENVQVEAYGEHGVLLPVSDLGFEGTFNFCNGRPLPSTCGGRTGTDQPRWDSASGTLRGNVVDTDGASGWFRPTARVIRVVFTATLNSGIPAYQLWIAAHDQPLPPPPQPGGNTPPISEPLPPIDEPVGTSPGEATTIPLPGAPDKDVVIESPPADGTVTVDPADGTVTYDPSGSFKGEDHFTLKIVEANGKVVIERFDVNVGLAQTGVYHLPELGAAAGALLLAGGALMLGFRKVRG